MAARRPNQITFEVDPELMKQMQAKAKEDVRSLASLARLFVVQGLRSSSKPQKAA